MTAGVADVIVMDGFTGNITLKLIEGVSGRTMRAIRDAAMTSPRAKLGGLLLRRRCAALREEIDPETAGRRVHARAAPARRGRPRPLHPRAASRGRSRSPRAGSQEDVIGQTRAALEQAGALRPPRGVGA